MSLHYKDTTDRNQRDLLEALKQNPLDPVLLTAIGDTAEEQDHHARANLLRDSRLAMLELLRGKSLDEEQCALVPAAPADREREISRLLGTPETTILPDLRTPEGVRAQVDFQRLLLASLDLLKEQNGHPGITGIDGRFHPLPPLDVIQSRLATPAMREKLEQGFDTLLLVPFALPLHRQIEAWKQGLLRNEHALPGGIAREYPLAAALEEYGPRDGLGPDEDGRLVYAPKRFGWIHRGRTKQQLLAAHPAAGWQVLLTEGALHDLPRAGQGQTVGGRSQVEAGRTPQEYLATLPAGETGWTPETYIAAFLTQLEQSGRPLDADSYTSLVGSYLPGYGVVPQACWDPSYRRADLNVVRPDYSHPEFGARTAVRVA